MGLTTAAANLPSHSSMCSLLPNCLQVQALKRDELQAWCDARGIAPNEQLRTVQKQERLVKALNVEYRAEKQAQQSYLKAQKEAEELVSYCSVAEYTQAAQLLQRCCHRSIVWIMCLQGSACSRACAVTALHS